MRWMKQAVLAGTLAAASMGVAPMVLGTTSAGAADPGAACYPSCSPPEVSGNNVTTLPNTSGNAAVTPTAATSPGDGTSNGSSSSSLPFTGADVAELAVIGAGTVAVGVVLTRRRRRVTPA